MHVDQYDAFSEIYSVWTTTAASARANLTFYVDAYLAAGGPVVELGVGDGRIAVEAALRGRHVIGVDLSRAMLERCRQRAEAAGVLDRMSLVLSDFRDLSLTVPAALVALPYHSIGHLQGMDEKRVAIERVFAQLEPGGCFMFDDFFMTPALMATMRQVQLRASYRTPSGAEALLWVTSLVDPDSQSIQVVTWEDELFGDGRLCERRYRRLHLSWLEPSQARDLLERAGFVVEACYGDFDRAPFSARDAHEQIWVARKPR